MGRGYAHEKMTRFGRACLEKGSFRDLKASIAVTGTNGAAEATMGEMCG